LAAEIVRKTQAHKSHQDDLRRKLKQLEDEEVAVAEALANMREAAMAQRLAVARQLDLLNLVGALNSPSPSTHLGSTACSLLPPHMQEPPSFLTVSMHALAAYPT